MAQQFLVDQKKWLDQRSFLELLTVSQVIPGPNIMILSTILGDRYFGWKGALSAFLGMISLPGILMLSVYVFYEHYAANPVVSAALAGMAASAAGMVVGAALRLVPDVKVNPVGKLIWILILIVTFVTVGVAKFSMFIVLPSIGIPVCLWAYYQIIKKAARAPVVVPSSEEGDK